MKAYHYCNHYNQRPARIGNVDRETRRALEDRGYTDPRPIREQFRHLERYVLLSMYDDQGREVRGWLGEFEDVNALDVHVLRHDQHQWPGDLRPV